MNKIQILKEEQGLEWGEIALECPKCSEIYLLDEISCSYCINNRLIENYFLEQKIEEVKKCLKEALQEKSTLKSTIVTLIEYLEKKWMENVITAQSILKFQK